jgi:hypothetical protein
MKINTKQAIKDLAGKEIKDGKTQEIFTYGMALSNILIGAKEGGKMKMFNLAQKCFNDDSVEVDTADLELIKKAVDGTDQYNILVTGQILETLSELKDTDKK